MPEWFKRMPAEYNKIDTVKRCIPFLDALTAGYLLPLHVDVRLAREGDEVKIEAPVEEVQFHSPDQFPGAPYPGMPALKFNIPWLIRTPPGYSTLFMSPLNRFPLPVLPLSGIVDTDTHYMAIAYPALCLLAPGQQIFIRRGTPMVQVIPFKRDDWKSVVGPYEAEPQQAHSEALKANMRIYKDERWQKKTFT